MADMFFMVVLLFLISLLPNYVFSDGSSGWHLATGSYIIDKGAIPYHDFLSYTFAGKPWIVLYWLFDVFMAAADNFGGLNGVALLISTIIATLFLLLFERCRKLGCHVFATFFFCLIAAIASTVHWLARPLVATFIGVFVFSTTLEDFHRRQITTMRLVVTLAITSLIWANCHPGFVTGFAMISIYLIVAAVASFVAQEDNRADARHEVKGLLLALSAALFTSFINPYGIALHQNILGYLAPSRLVHSVDEYMSPVFHGGLQSNCLELLFFLPVIGLALRRVRVSVPQLLLCLAFAHLALSEVRNVPLFAIVVLPFIGELFSGKIMSVDLATIDKSALWQKLAAKWDTIGEQSDAAEIRCKMHLLPLFSVLVLAVAAANGGKLFGSTFMDSGFDSQRLPVQSLNYIRDNKLPAAEGFNHVNWGGYLYYKLGMPVFIDDRASFFGTDFYYGYGTVVSLYPGWQNYFDEHHINWIIFAKHTPLDERLRNDPKWKLCAEDTAADVFVRRGSNLDNTHSK